MAKPKTPLIAADCIVVDEKNRLLLIRRGKPPFKGAYALPGGFMDMGETIESTCRRELREETGVRAGRLKLVGVYSDPRRDPRGHTVTVTFLTRVKSPRAKAGDDAAEVEWVRHWKKLKLAFDHKLMLRDARKLGLLR